MYTKPFLVAASLLTLTAATVVAVQSTTAPTTQSSKPRAVRLVQPWSKVADLTDEQKGQIGAVHAEIVDRINVLQAEERERCMAILTEPQRVALQETLDREAAERKARQRRPASQPAGE